MKKVVIFDLDGTLTASKSPLDSEMAGLLGKLLGVAKVAVISGGSYAQFQKQFLVHLGFEEAKLSNLLLVPTNGSAMYHYENGNWMEVYAERLEKIEREKIIDAIHQAIKVTGLPKEKVLYGETIEDRGTQVTFSGLGQLAPLERKLKWDPDRRKRLPIKEYLDKHVPEFEVRVNSSSSIDVTRKGIDKAYGVEKISSRLNIPIAEMVFVGDALYPGGNDNAVLKTGIETVAVKDSSETKDWISRFISGTSI